MKQLFEVLDTAVVAVDTAVADTAADIVLAVPAAAVVVVVDTVVAAVVDMVVVSFQTPY